MPIDEAQFRSRIETALANVRTLLDRTREPQVPADVPHAYADKFRLVEFITRSAIAGSLTCLEALGLSPEGLAQLREWAKTRTVTLRLEAQEDCRFLRETKREEVAPHQRVTEIQTPGGDAQIRDKIVTTITEYWWSFEFTYRVFAFQGTETHPGLTICERAGRIELVTRTENAPRKKTVVRPTIDADISWLLQHVDEHSRLAFTIDRTDPRCHTPRRNPEIEAGIGAFVRFSGWCKAVAAYFQGELFPVQRDPGERLDLSALNTDELFSPVVPLFEGDGRGGPPADGEVLPAAYANTFLEEQLRRLNAKRQRLAQAFPRDDSVITAWDVCLVVTVMHARRVCSDFGVGVTYVEEMLRQQLIAAIGKEVTPADFAEYMTFHHRKLFKPEFRPQPFSYAVRRPEHDPEGALSLETDGAPIATLVQRGAANAPMHFPLDASTRVAFLGDRYLHGWVAHQFSGASPSLRLVARARQFSSYIVMVGRIASADTFEPRHALIVHNKDAVEIPLLLEQIPTPKEFRDAIESLSPEQQRFAKAFRGMQLESTLFGVCVVQIKPQLETLLKLPPDSLTKEIKLTQDLLELFMEYQIPSDLLSYEGTPEAAPEDKLERVREYVGRMKALIQEEKDEELRDARQREAWRRAESDRSATLSIDPFGGGPGGDPFAAPPGGAADPFSTTMDMVGSSGADPFGGAPMASAFAAPPSMRASAPPLAPGGFGSSAAPPPAPTPSPAPQPAPPADSAGSGGEAPPPPQVVPTDATPAGLAEGGGVDYTQIPKQLDRRLDALDTDSAVRPTIINPGDPWTKRFKKSLLAEVEETTLSKDGQRKEKDKAFDLIDALSKSGDLPFADASLHVVIAATHCFDQTLLETVIQGNVNPIEKVERSAMIVATTIHGQPATALLTEGQRQRFFATSPQLAGPEDALPG